MRSRWRRSGYSLVELLLVAALFVGFLLISAMLLKLGESMWDRTSSSGDVMLELQQARAAMERDLRETSLDDVRTAEGSARGTDPAGRNVIWFRSSFNPKTSDNALQTTGEPLWQRNILYYTAVPTRHNSLFGVACDARDERCPHKFLLRRVFAMAPAPDPTSTEVPVEPRMTESDALLRTVDPRGFDLALSGPPDEGSTLVAHGIVGFSVKLAPDTEYPGEVRVAVSGFDLHKAAQKVQLGRQNLRDSPFIHTLVFSVFPDN